jgi:hypothetical protein
MVIRRIINFRLRSPKGSKGVDSLALPPCVDAELDREGLDVVSHTVTTDETGPIVSLYCEEAH